MGMQQKMVNGKKVWVPNTPALVEHARQHVKSEFAIQLLKIAPKFSSDEYDYELTEQDVEDVFFDIYTSLRSKKWSKG